MTESENTGVEEAIAEPANVIAQEDTSSGLEQATENIDQGLNETSPDDQDRNWKALREEKSRLQKENEAISRKAEEYEQFLIKLAHQQQTPVDPPEKEETIDIQPDDWLTYEQYEKLNRKSVKREIQEALKEDRKVRANEEMPSRIQTKYPDFSDVVTEDNVKQLKALEPEVAQALNGIGDKYSQAIAAYKYIKKLMPQAQEQTQYKERVEKNSKKPGSLSSVGSSSLSQAQGFEKGLTPELKRQLYEEMKAASKS